MTATDVTIRDMQDRDMPAVLRIEKVADDGVWTFRDFTVWRKHETAVLKVAEKDGAVIGFIIFHSPNHARLAILNLSVDPAFEDTDVADQLLQNAIDFLKERGFVMLTLEVEEEDEEGAEFFTRHGFIQEGIIPNHFGDGLNARYLELRSEKFR